ncbi:recombinase family protein [Ferruginibacter albus]|nr:recombinase family protein [Ferruginibacter albus]
MGVHLFEASTGRNTTTIAGKLEIYQALLEAQRENYSRLAVTISGMIKHLEKGYRFGKAGRGYDHFGPKVKDYNRMRKKQEIRINKEGKILRQAWKWKLQGEKDCIIIKKLSNLGVKISKQALSKMWRDPFYCGISTSRMLDGKVVYGQWEKMVSEQDFLYVQEIIKGNRHGYKHDNSSPKRPLSGFIRCQNCGKKMTGYEVKNKKTHYYKCQKCLGVSINVETTPKAKGKGANDLFIEELNKYQLPVNLIEPFKEQLKLTYNTLNGDLEQSNKLIYEQLEKLKIDFKKLKTRYALNADIDSDVYQELKTDFELKISTLESEIENGSQKISNLDNYITLSAEIVGNISKYWAFQELETQKRIQELVFPEGIMLDTKNRVYLTSKVNLIFEESSMLVKDSKEENKNDNDKKPLSSSIVARSRLELPTFGL